MIASIISKGGVYAGGALEVVTLFERRFFEASSVLSSLFVFFFFVFANASLDSSRKTLTNPIKVLGYLPDWRIANETTSESIVNALCARTDAILLFSIEVDENGQLEKLDRLPSAVRSRKAEKCQETVRVRNTRNDRRIFTNERFCKSDEHESNAKGIREIGVQFLVRTVRGYL